MYSKKLYYLGLLLLLPRIYCVNNYDLTIVSRIIFADALCRLPIGLMDCLHKSVKINFVSTVNKNGINYQEVPSDVINIIKNESSFPGTVGLLMDSLWYTSYNNANKVPNCKIKIAYSMIESTAIPNQWVSILNSGFDAVVVPDEFLVDVYQKSGVKIPIFVIPCGLYLELLLSKPLKTTRNEVFTFGMSGAFLESKNHELVLKAFAEAFGSNTKVRLCLHGRSGDSTNLEKLAIKKNLKNINIINKKLSHTEYINLITSFDCYVLLSKGEGFSITPREAMALGIPCILSNNTAHKTICNTGLVKAIPSYILEPANYKQLFGRYCGYQFNCRLEDAILALKDMYNNYQKYLNNAYAAREWSKQYLYKNLKARYLNLIKPKKVVLGDKNIIMQNYLVTNSISLYNKYLKYVNSKSYIFEEKILEHIQ